MRLVLQRVKEALVAVDGKIIGRIGKGILVLLGIRKDDTADKIVPLVDKLIHLRIFDDEQGKMNLSVQDIGGEILIVSQFTLYGDCSKGRRPEYLDAAPASFAKPLYDQFVEEVRKQLSKVETGSFGSHMEVSLINDGPVTFIL